MEKRVAEVYDEVMTVHLDPQLADALIHFAENLGTDIDSLINDVMRNYLEMIKLREVSSDDLAAAQLAMLPELDGFHPDNTMV